MEGMFDVAPSERSTQTWNVQLDLPAEWNVGVIVGPSGAGKSSVAREIFGKDLVDGFTWPKDKSLLDGFPAGMSIKDIVGLLSSVGFSSPPSWVWPFHVLSNGEQFRVTMARALACVPQGGRCVVDEFTSVVDRTVAKIGSAAIAKTVRRRKQQFVAVSCHYDIVEWLEPDWIYQPHINKLELPRGAIQRPRIELEIRRVHPAAWRLFKHHHYLTAALNRSAHCFAGFVEGQPVCFDSWLPHVGRVRGGRMRRCHRIVCLPDYQGVGIGNAMLSHDASIWKGLGIRAAISTSNPAFVHRLARDKNWVMTAAPRRTAPERGSGDVGTEATRSSGRLVASFEYRGPAMERDKAAQLVG
jgi:GNAT superfamily N-acetyltransferase